MSTADFVCVYVCVFGYMVLILKIRIWLDDINLSVIFFIQNWSYRKIWQERTCN